jgi:hypothetical protein
MTTADWFRLLADVVTIIGLPFAVVVFIWEQRKERQIEQEELYQRLSDEYTTFMKLVIDNSDLKLLGRGIDPADLTEEQGERRTALFSILVSLFERAYLLVYDEKMNRDTARLWQSWEDSMRDWCKRPDFRSSLPTLLQGEDPAFASHLARLAIQTARTLHLDPPDLRAFLDPARRSAEAAHSVTAPPR